MHVLYGGFGHVLVLLYLFLNTGIKWDNLTILSLAGKTRLTDDVIKAYVEILRLWEA